MKRLLTGLVLTALWLLLLFKGGTVLFWLVTCLVAALALGEYFAMTLPRPEEKPWRWLGIGAGLLPVLAGGLGSETAVAGGLFAGLLVGGLATVIGYRRFANPLLFLMTCGFGTLYPGFCSAHLVLLRENSHGPAWLLLLSAITIASDSCAYYVGSLTGRHKLCPAISPGKTVEGFLGGLAGAVAAAAAAGALLLPGGHPLQFAAIAFMLSSIGVLGDLLESVIKRTCGVKDSGRLLPGHGGVLDRIDSLLLATPALYYLLQLGWLRF